MREQSFLKSELGLGLGDLGLENLPAEGTESVFSHGNSDSSSVCSTASRKAGVGSSELTGKSKSQSKKLYRASVALTPTPPVRAGTGQQVESSEELADSKPEMEHKLERVTLVPSFDEIHKSVEQEELQQVIREVRREGLRSKMFEWRLLKIKDKLYNLLPLDISIHLPAKAPYSSCPVFKDLELIIRYLCHNSILK